MSNMYLNLDVLKTSIFRVYKKLSPVQFWGAPTQTDVIEF